jgi:serine protease Do
MSGAPPRSGNGSFEALVLHLTGPFRGARQHLFSDEISLGTAADVDVRFPAELVPGVAPCHASLTRSADGRFLLRVPDGETVYVNGESVEERALASGDVIALGESGPMLRFLLLRDAPRVHKSIGEAFADTIDCARHGSASAIGRAWLVLRTLPRQLLTRTSPFVRLLTGVLVLTLLTSVGVLVALSIRLERRITEEGKRVRAVEELMRNRTDSLTDPAIRAWFQEVAAALSERVEALEAMSDAGRRVVRASEPAVVFLQGAYGWTAPDGRVLRLVVGPDGGPLPGADGRARTTLEGEGPPFASQFTGSGFLVRDDGLIVTNRHVAVPWGVEPAAAPMLKQGFRPELRLLVYAPGIRESFEATFVASSETADLALLRAPGFGGRADPLQLGASSPGPGDEILVLGYPAGINALLARSGALFLDSLRVTRPDFWKVVEELSEADLIRPLATRGIVGQRTRASVVYDAETARGGSGGPVLSLEGEVVAVTFAVMEEFGGSNLGVPVEEVRALVAEAPDSPEPDPELPPDAAELPPGPI